MVYVEREGRQFGMEDRARVVRDSEILHAVATTAVFTFPVLRARLWALFHGYGWVPVR